MAEDGIDVFLSIFVAGRKRFGGSSLHVDALVNNFRRLLVEVLSIKLLEDFLLDVLRFSLHSDST